LSPSQIKNLVARLLVRQGPTSHLPLGRTHTTHRTGIEIPGAAFERAPGAFRSSNTTIAAKSLAGISAQPCLSGASFWTCDGTKMLIRVFLSCCDSVASPQATALCADEARNIYSVVLLICRVLSLGAAASRGRRQRFGHRPEHHDDVRATEAM
jgi:hypothetical protein